MVCGYGSSVSAMWWGHGHSVGVICHDDQSGGCGHGEGHGQTMVGLRCKCMEQWQGHGQSWQGWLWLLTPWKATAVVQPPTGVGGKYFLTQDAPLV